MTRLSSSMTTLDSSMNNKEDDDSPNSSSSVSTSLSSDRWVEHPPQRTTTSTATTTTTTTTPAAAPTVHWDWQRLAREVFQNDTRPIILFDGVCNLCNGGVNFAMDHDTTGKLRFCSLQSKVGQSLLLRCGKLPGDMSSIMYVTSDHCWCSSDAVSRICMQLDGFVLPAFGRVGQMTPGFVREAIYQLVSHNRYRFGEYDSCRLDFDGELTSRFVLDPEEDDKEKKEEETKKDKDTTGNDQTTL